MVAHTGLIVISNVPTDCVTPKILFIYIEKAVYTPTVISPLIIKTPARAKTPTFTRSLAKEML